jgi:putative ABC transport system ATP-binding protein
MRRVIETRKVTKHYVMGDLVVKALRGIDLTVTTGEFVAIMGASGSGKSTLLNVIGCLDQPTSGTYLLDGVDTSHFTRDEYAEVRNQRIGFVFQVFNLLPRTSALDNVELPIFYDRSGRFQDPKAAAAASLERVGLGDRMHHDPSELSGGQRQRVALARALVNNPSIILADEPTGNLDSRTSVEVMSVFQELNEQGITILLVTHEPDIAQYAKRIVVMRDGLIVSDRPVWDRKNAAEDLASMPSADELVDIQARKE